MVQIHGFIMTVFAIADGFSGFVSILYELLADIK
jgi:hypothetical protein